MSDNKDLGWFGNPSPPADYVDEEEQPAERTISLEPDSEGYARLARQFAEVILADVKKSRQSADRSLLVETLKIAAHIEKPVLARLIVALEQDEAVAIMPVQS